MFGAAVADDAPGFLRVALSGGGEPAGPGASVFSVLKSWGPEDFQSLKMTSSREKDPESGETAQWKGVLLSHLVDKAIEGLSNEQRSRIDLVILRNAAGAQAYVPRFLVAKYPLLIASQRNGRLLDTGVATNRGPLFSLVPWTSHPKIREEELPLERYFVGGVTQIELSSYQILYGSYFLKRRTDPVAMRGEKVFVQTCLSCHLPGSGSPGNSRPTPNFVALTETRASGPGPGLAETVHRNVPGFPRLQERNRRAVTSYLEAFHAESPAKPGAANSQVSQAGSVTKN